MTTRARYQSLNWSFQANPETLGSLDKLLSENFREVVWSCRLSDGSVVKPKTLQSLLKYDFSESHRIVSLEVEGSFALRPQEGVVQEESRRTSVEFNRYGGIDYFVSMNAEDSFEFERKLRMLLERCRPAYAWVRDYIKIRRLLFYVVLCGGGGAVIELAAFESIGRHWFRYGLTAQMLAGIWVLLEDQAFPRSEFSFGGNENRVKRTVFWRIGLVGSLVSTVVGALLLAAF